MTFFFLSVRSAKHFWSMFWRTTLSILREINVVHQISLLNCHVTCNSLMGHRQWTDDIDHYEGWQSCKECQDAHVTQFSFNYLGKGTDDIFFTSSFVDSFDDMRKENLFKDAPCELELIKFYYDIDNLVEKHSFENALRYRVSHITVISSWMMEVFPVTCVSLTRDGYMVRCS